MSMRRMINKMAREPHGVATITLHKVSEHNENEAHAKHLQNKAREELNIEMYGTGPAGQRSGGLQRPEEIAHWKQKIVYWQEVAKTERAKADVFGAELDAITGRKRSKTKPKGYVASKIRQNTARRNGSWKPIDYSNMINESDRAAMHDYAYDRRDATGRLLSTEEDEKERTDLRRRARKVSVDDLAVEANREAYYQRKDTASDSRVYPPSDMEKIIRRNGEQAEQSGVAWKALPHEYRLMLKGTRGPNFSGWTNDPQDLLGSRRRYNGIDRGWLPANNRWGEEYWNGDNWIAYI